MDGAAAWDVVEGLEVKVEADGLAANEAYRARGLLMVARGAARGNDRSSIFFLLYCVVADA